MEVPGRENRKFVRYPSTGDGSFGWCGGEGCVELPEVTEKIKKSSARVARGYLIVDSHKRWDASVGFLESMRSLIDMLGGNSGIYLATLWSWIGKSKLP